MQNLATVTRDRVRIDEVSFGDVLDLGGADAVIDGAWGSGFSYRVAGSEKFEHEAPAGATFFRLGRTC